MLRMMLVDFDCEDDGFEEDDEKSMSEDEVEEEEKEEEDRSQDPGPHFVRACADFTIFQSHMI